MDAEKFGNALRGMRNEIGLTLDELGKRAGFKKSYLSLIENGKQGLPKPETLRKLAIGLNVDYHMLMLMAGYIDSKQFTRNKLFGAALNDLKENIETKEGISIENLSDEQKKEGLNKAVEAAKRINSFTSDKINKKDIDLYQLFEAKECKHSFYYEGQILQKRDIENIMKFIENFILKEGE